ncbi:MAG: RagB/SusD family nutrient uptake outer membrane protein [Dysgonamonadaceae bacterium]|jgi:tetratricopeptide (TPR) repeat protein|nr:RagB/SusD family nutrient uptake outer membrane protein [Dysgonamonadaceae bacterium]
MKTVNKLFSLLAVAALTLTPTLTGCIEETFPEGDTATSEQIGASAEALQASLNGIPSQMSQGYLVYGSQTHETDMAYPQFMIAQTELLGDIYPFGSNSGYDWYRNYNTFNGSMGANSYFAFLPWFTLYKFVKSANDIIAAVDITDENLSPSIRGAAGVAYACRAFDYYLLTVLFEPVENKYTDCSKVLGLTVPFVTEETTGEIAKNNPRASHDDMIAFILSDLDKAEQCLADYTPDSKMFPSLAVAYGIKAKVYLWDGKYDKAAEYARRAIDVFGGSPVTAAQWEDVNTGFNTANQAWMWYINYAAESMGNLCNFTGWMSGEADWGYSSLTRPGIDRSLYDKIADTDFRKHTFLDPKKYEYYNYKTSRDKEFINDAPAYLSLKFRCKNGDWKSYSIGGAVDVPVMRVEEMYLIEAEAVGASQGVSAGVAKLNDFMKTYRQADYNFTTSDLRTLQLEVLAQMRIEFWGEGNAFPTAKRLKPGVMQNYEGTNAPADIFKVNCEGIKPNWNLVIPITEVNANKALDGNNNPDPTATIEYPSPVGEYSTKK